MTAARSCRRRTPRSRRASPRSGPWPRSPAARPAGCWTRTSSTATSTPSPAWPATARATCGPSTRRCTASVARPCCRCWRPPASRRRRWSSSRRSRTPSSRRWRSPTPRSPARWTSRWRWPRPTTSTWWSPTTRTPTGARPPSRASTAGGCCAATRSARCSATTCCTRASRARTPARSSRRRCSARWRPSTGSRTPRRSPASSGSAACPTWPSATRRRSATASIPST